MVDESGWSRERAADDEDELARPEVALGDEGVRVHDGEVVELEVRAGESVVDRVGVEPPAGSSRALVAATTTSFAAAPVAGGRGAGEERAVEVRRHRALRPA